MRRYARVLHWILRQWKNELCRELLPENVSNEVNNYCDLFWHQEHKANC
jgi:hypothetical protein